VSLDGTAANAATSAVAPDVTEDLPSPCPATIPARGARYRVFRDIWRHERLEAARTARPGRLEVPWTGPRANLVAPQMSGDRTVDLYSFAGTIDLAVDLAGYYALSPAPSAAPPPRQNGSAKGEPTTTPLRREPA
jgi:hypothetical protein